MLQHDTPPTAAQRRARALEIRRRVLAILWLDFLCYARGDAQDGARAQAYYDMHQLVQGL